MTESNQNDVDDAIVEEYPYKIVCIKSDGTPVSMTVDEVRALLGVNSDQPGVSSDPDMIIDFLRSAQKSNDQLTLNVATLQKTIDEFDIKYVAIKNSYETMQQSFASIASDIEKIKRTFRIDQGTGPVTLPLPPKVGL